MNYIVCHSVSLHVVSYFEMPLFVFRIFSRDSSPRHARFTESTYNWDNRLYTTHKIAAFFLTDSLVKERRLRGESNSSDSFSFAFLFRLLFFLFFYCFYYFSFYHCMYYFHYYPSFAVFTGIFFEFPGNILGNVSGMFFLLFSKL